MEDSYSRFLQDEDDTRDPALKEAIDSYLEDLGRIAFLTKAQEFDLAIKSKQGDLQARKQLALSILPLVVNIAKKYQGRGVELLELIQIGNLGLMYCIVKKYNPKLGFRLTTYATFWIRQAISRAIDEDGSIRIPTTTIEKISNMNQMEDQLYQKVGRDPTTEKLAQALKITKQQVLELQSFDILKEGISLDTPQNGVPGEEYVFTLKDSLVDSEADSSEGDPILGDCITQALGTLNPRERQVIELRYGLHDGCCYSQQEIAEVLHLTRERIRQIEKQALEHLNASLEKLFAEKNS